MPKTLIPGLIVLVLVLEKDEDEDEGSVQFQGVFEKEDTGIGGARLTGRGV